MSRDVLTTSSAGTMENSSYLIQRLEKPWHRTTPEGEKIDNPFSFGGGLKNGGLTKEAMGLLRDIFSFDYMGAAEFEFGAVPEALRGLAAKQLVAFSMHFTEKDVRHDDWAKGGPYPLVRPFVYVICDGEDEPEVRRRIKRFARYERDYKARKDNRVSTKESVGLYRAMRRPEEASHPRTVGWLELDNGYFFFVDEDMWRKTAELFGVPLVVLT